MQISDLQSKRLRAGRARRRELDGLLDLRRHVRAGHGDEAKLGEKAGCGFGKQVHRAQIEPARERERFGGEPPAHAQTAKRFLYSDRAQQPIQTMDLEGCAADHLVLLAGDQSRGDVVGEAGERQAVAREQIANRRQIAGVGGLDAHVQMVRLTGVRPQLNQSTVVLSYVRQ